MSLGPQNNLMKRVALDNPRYYFNRHVQWLEFNRRILDEARDIGNPLLERVKFTRIWGQAITTRPRRGITPTLAC